MSQLEQRPAQAGETQGDSMVAETKHKVEEGAGQAVEAARDRAGQATDRLRRTVDERSTDLGRRAGSVAQAMRRTSEELRAQGKESEASLNDRALEVVERVGRYLEEADARRMASQAQDLGRRRPWLVALAGAGIGLLGARLVKSSASRPRSGDSPRSLGIGPGYPSTAAGSPTGGPPPSGLSTGGRP